MGAYTLRNAGTISNQDGNSISLTVAGGGVPTRSAGDLLLLAFLKRAAATYNGPTISGWTLLAGSRSTYSQTNESCILYARIATADASDEISALDWTSDGSVVTQMAAFQGNVYTELSTLLDAGNAGAGTGSQTASITSAALASANGFDTDNALVIFMGANQKTATQDGATIGSHGLTATTIGSLVTSGTGTMAVWGYIQQVARADVASSSWSFSPASASALYSTRMTLALKTLPSTAITPNPASMSV